MLSMRDVKLGDRLRADSGFTCIEGGTVLEVAQDDEGELYVPCSHGKHYIKGQVDVHGRVVGFAIV